MDTHYFIWQCLTSLYVFTYETWKWIVFFQHKQCVHLTRLFFAVTQWSPVTNISPKTASENDSTRSEKRLNIQCMILGNEPVPESLFKIKTRHQSDAPDQGDLPLMRFLCSHTTCARVLKTVRRQDCWALTTRVTLLNQKPQCSTQVGEGFHCHEQLAHKHFFLHFLFSPRAELQILCEVCLVVYHIWYTFKKCWVVST